MPGGLTRDIGLRLMYEPQTRSWLESGNSLESFFDGDDDDAWQGNVVFVEDLALEVCAVRATDTGFRVYVRLASAVDELVAACSDTNQGVKS